MKRDGVVAIVLASTSAYRKVLLERLGLRFSVAASHVDEASGPGENGAALAARLARAKSFAVAPDHPDALVIGSDQVAEIDGQMLGKPGNAAIARAQLARCSDRTVRFHTAICVLDTRVDPPAIYTAIDATEVVFRPLQADEIARYVDAERPLDCAGSFKVEGLGVTLFERIDSSDPTALIGLPLIALSRLLRKAGILLP